VNSGMCAPPGWWFGVLPGAERTYRTDDVLVP
jgi:hypothetical protein